MQVYGGEVHVDTAKANAYIGYSHIDAVNVFPLGGAIEVLHSVDGLALKENYFGAIDPIVSHYQPTALNPNPDPNARNDSGKVDSVLFQATTHLSAFLGRPRNAADVALGVFGMYNHIDSPSQKQDRLKFGADLNVIPTSFMALALRFDRVMPDGPNSDLAITAISPRVIFHTNWLSREYVMVSYSRYVYGSAYGATSTGGMSYTSYTAPVTNNNLLITMPAYSAAADFNLFVVSAAISF
jgi:hypothetical protein